MQAPPPNVNNGFYKLEFKEDGVFLIVYPPEGMGKRVDAEEVKERLRKKQVRNFSVEAVEDTVRQAGKEPVKIAEPQEEIAVNAVLSICIRLTR